MNRRTDLGGRWMGLTFLVLAVVATGMLIAGYGFAVGIGALAGLLLAFAAGFFIFLSVWRGDGQVSFGAGPRSHMFGEMNSNPDAQREEAEQLQRLTEILSVDLGRVVKVIPVLTTVPAAGLWLDLVDVELCEAGMSINVDVRVSPGNPHPASLARASITDDVGTVYRASAQGQGWMPSRIRLDVRTIPAPPATATSLHVRIEEFVDPLPGLGNAVVGPWVFDIALTPAQGAATGPSR
jgi:hypothetical protein